MMPQHTYKIPSHHNREYLVDVRGQPMPLNEMNWPPVKHMSEPMTTRMTRWRHSHLLVILVILAAVMLVLALVSGTVLYYHCKYFLVFLLFIFLYFLFKEIITQEFSSFSWLSLVFTITIKIIIRRVKKLVEYNILSVNLKN